MSPVPTGSPFPQIHASIVPDALLGAFARFGPIEGHTWRRHSDCAFIDFAAPPAALEARRALDGATLGSPLPLRVEFKAERRWWASERGRHVLAQHMAAQQEQQAQQERQTVPLSGHRDVHAGSGAGGSVPVPPPPRHEAGTAAPPPGACGSPLRGRPEQRPPPHAASEQRSARRTRWGEAELATTPAAAPAAFEPSPVTLPRPRSMPEGAPAAAAAPVAAAAAARGSSTDLGRLVSAVSAQLPPYVLPLPPGAAPPQQAQAQQAPAWRGTLTKSRGLVCAAVCLDGPEPGGGGWAAAEPAGWPAALDVAHRVALEHVCGQLLGGGPPSGRAVRRLAAAEPAGRRALADFCAYLQGRGRAGLAALPPLVPSGQPRALYLVPPSPQACAALGVPPDACHECILALVMPGAPAAGTAPPPS